MKLTALSRQAGSGCSLSRCSADLMGTAENEREDAAALEPDTTKRPPETVLGSFMYRLGPKDQKLTRYGTRRLLCDRRQHAGLARDCGLVA